MTSSTAWNDDEDELLQGLPHVAQVMYLRGLRQYMDYGTGIVGIRRKISWKMLREVVEVSPHQGVADSGQPTMGKVRRTMEWLIRVGLVEHIGSSQRGEPIIFRLPLATTDESVSKKPGMNPARVDRAKPGIQPGNEITSNGAGCSAKPDTQPGMNPARVDQAKPGTHPVSGREEEEKTHGASPSFRGEADAVADSLRSSAVCVTKQRGEHGTVPEPDFALEPEEPRQEARRRRRKPRNRNVYSVEFEAAWREYPKREGSNPKEKAWQAWQASIRKSATAQDMAEGVARYKRYIERRGLVGSRYVQQAATFFGHDKGYQAKWEIHHAAHESGRGSAAERAKANRDHARKVATRMRSEREAAEQRAERNGSEPLAEGGCMP